MNRVIIATTTSYKSIEDHRAKIALRTIQAAKRNGHKIFVVDASAQCVKDQFAESGAIVLQDTGKTMGEGRRHAISQALIASKKGQFIAWIEPEKDTVVPFLESMTSHELTIPKRNSLESYPLHQQYAENMGNEAFRIRTGYSLDMWFGPRIFKASLAKFFIDYAGKYGDKWDSIFIPVLHAIAARVDVGEFAVDFTYPSEQLAAEKNSFEMVQKRIEQLRSLVLATDQECTALGM